MAPLSRVTPIYLTVAAALASAVPTKSLLAQGDERIAWLNANTVSLAAPDTADLGDLEPLAAAIGNARIVAIGEICHTDGGTFAMRNRIIRFLHERMGFDVLAWEGGLVEFWRLNDLLRGDAPLTPLGTLRYPCTESGIVRPLFDYARASWHTPRPLIMAGIDGEQPDHGADGLSALLKELLASSPDLARPAETVAGIEQLFARAAHPAQPERVTDAERTAQRRDLERLIADLGRARDALTRRWSPRELSIREQALRAALIYERVCHELFGQLRAVGSPSGLAPEIIYELGNLRDAEMARLCTWLVDEFFAGHKVILCAASAHLVHAFGSIRDSEARAPMLDRKRLTPLGDLLHRRYGRSLYTILFTAHGGSHGCEFTDGRPPYIVSVPEPSADCLEDLLHRSGKGQAFLDLRLLPETHWLRRPMAARPMGFGENVATWPDCADAFLFLDQMTADRHAVR